MGHSLLREFMAHAVSPVVVVLSTALAEQACQKNGLSFVDLLRPFGSLLDINVPVRTASETSYRLQGFQLRLFHSSEIMQTSAEAADAHLAEVVSSVASHVASDEVKGDPRQLDAVDTKMRAESVSLLYQQYCVEFMKTLAFSDHEAIDHPVACLLVVSSKDEKPLNSFAELLATENLPALMNDGSMDPRILKHYVVLHDNQDGNHDQANETLQELHGALGVNDCRLLCINSRKPGDNNAIDKVLFKHAKVLEPEKLGCSLSSSDLDEVQGFVLDICQKHIIPYLEQRVRVLNQQVSATRKGLKNQIKNLWWRKKDETPETSAVYTYSSMESQIRTLADYAFMLRDYELALSNYRLVSSDYKADKALKRYAGSMEMIGICLCFLDQSRRDADSSLETAYMTYQICGIPSTRYATRTAIWWAEVHKSRGQYREAASVFFRAATEMEKEATLRAGVLLEQSAYCYLDCTPPMMRKYGFHLVLAGIRYHVTGQKQHALRSYTRALSVYDGQVWQSIHDHLNSYLGRISSSLGQLDVAILYFMNLMASNQQPAPNQAAYLREFLAAVQNSRAKDEILRVQLPAIDPEHVHVQFEDHRTYASSAAASLPEDTWLHVEEGLVPSTSGSVVTWLDAPKSQKRVRDFNVCIAGEEVTVSFHVSNPLQIPIGVTNLELVCEFEPGLLLIEQDQVLSSSDKSNQSLVLSKESFSLKGQENRRISLTVKPNEEGLLNILGVKWVLYGIVHGQHDFATDETRGRSVETPPDKRLKFRVASHMPKLEVALHELPAKVNCGEIRRLVLEIQNPSHVSIKNIKLKASQPAFIMVGEQDDLDLELPSYLESRERPFQQERRNVYFDARSSIWSLPQEIGGSSTCLWPLWLHAGYAGEFLLKMVLYFETAEASSSLRFRTVRMAHSLQVIPSLDVSAHISPSAVMSDVYLVRMDVANAHPSESFWLRQASAVGDSWCLSAVQSKLLEQADKDREASISPSQLVLPGQCSSFFFHIQRSHTLTASNTTASCNLDLGRLSNTGPMIDVHSGPFYYFHQQESQAQSKKFQDSEEDFVDIILIAEQQEDIGSVNPGAQDIFRFASHHICYCGVEGGVALTWALEAPSCIEHDFSNRPVCEIPLQLAIRNCSRARALVKIETIGSNLTTSTMTDEETSPHGASSLESVSTATTTKASDGSYLWCGSKSVTTLALEGGRRSKIPLSVAMFAPGVFDLSSYKISWSLIFPQLSGEVKQQQKRFNPAPATLSTSFTGLGSTTTKADDFPVQDAPATALGHRLLLPVLQKAS